MKSTLAWFAENHVAANLLMMFLILAGVYTGATMKIEVFPESAPDVIFVSTTYPGASPEEIEEGVIRLIEEKVAGLAGVKRIDSTAREGVGTVRIEVMAEWDLKQLLDEVKAEVDRISSFPEEAEKPVIREAARRNEVISVAVFGDAPETTIKHLTEQVQAELTNIEGITLAEISGVRPSEIHIEISEKTLRRYGLTLSQVAQVVAASSLDLPAGSVKTSAGEILIRAKGRRYTAEDFRDAAVIVRSDGSRVALGRIAEISEGFQDLDLGFRFQGQTAASIQVYRVADQNAITVADLVKEYTSAKRETLPHGVSIETYRDMSEVLKSRLNLLLKNMAMGLVLVGILLTLFMNFRLAFWVTLGIPISFLFSLIFLPWQEVSINMVSLFAFIMVLGIVVDDAIIIGENIFRKQEEGLPRLKASISGAVEVGLPVVFSVLTTVAAFWPLLLAGGMMGRIMRNLPIVVILVLLGSLVESLLILPAHLSGAGRGKSSGAGTGNKEKRTARLLKNFINGPYTKAVTFAVNRRWAVLSFGIMLVLFVAGTFTSGLLKFTFFPKVEGDVLSCSITMPTGTSEERTLEVVQLLEDKAREAIGEYEADRPAEAPPLLQQTAALIGSQAGGHGSPAEFGGHLAQIWVVLLEGEKRKISAAELTRAWRRKIGIIPDVETLSFQSDLFRAGNPVEVHLSLADNQKLLAAAEELKEELSKYPGVFDVGDSHLPGKYELKLKLKPAARTLGLTLNDLAVQVRNAFYGAEALRFLRGQDEVKVMVRYPEDERTSLASIENMRISTPSGNRIPFRLAAEVSLERGYATIERAQRLRVIKVTADVDENITNANEVRGTLEKNFLPRLQEGHPGLRYTIEGEGKEQKESLSDVFKGFALALFCIYALLAVPFKSFSQPFVVMAAIPFGVAGALAGHLIMGFNLSLISLFGIVGLTGVVVNDSLVLIHAANRFREEGSDPVDAVVQAGAMRFRAILLTSLTTFAGLTPMLLEKSIQAQFLIPMAVSLGFGVLFATLVTLILIPCGYIILEDLLSLPGRLGLLRTQRNKRRSETEG